MHPIVIAPKQRFQCKRRAISATCRNSALVARTADFSDVINTSQAFELSPNGSGGWNSSVMHDFVGTPDGDNAQGTPVLDKAGNVYGTTSGGGANGCGTVYRLSPEKKGSWKEVLYSFKCGTANGAEPFGGVVLDAAGNIYGTTYSGGPYGFGTVFEIVAPSSKGGYKEKLLWTFDGTDGANPYFGTLVRDSAGNLYGTTLNGGSNGAGVAFKVTP